VTILVIRDRVPSFVEGAIVITEKRLIVSEEAAVNTSIATAPRITARDIDLLDPVCTSTLCTALYIHGN